MVLGHLGPDRFFMGHLGQRHLDPSGSSSNFSLIRVSPMIYEAPQYDVQVHNLMSSLFKLVRCFIFNWYLIYIREVLLCAVCIF